MNFINRKIQKLPYYSEILKSCYINEYLKNSELTLKKGKRKKRKKKKERKKKRKTRINIYFLEKLKI